MEGNFLSRYNNKLEDFEKKITCDPSNKLMYESEMADYIIRCMPYMSRHAEEQDEKISHDNVFNCKETKGLDRKDIYLDYLAEVENMNVDRISIKKKEECDYCKTGNLLYFSETTDVVCGDCCKVVDVMLSEELTYREEHESTEKIINYSYKRENHFNEWLSQFQAQEMTNIPPEVIDNLRIELKKLKIKKLEDITHTKIRGLLKKLKLNKYYEHVPYITNILNGINAPKMPQELEERLRIMFKDIQAPFEKHCPPERKNFLSYSYVLYKFCELLGEDEYLQYFPLLKSKEKLYNQDVLFKKICEDLKLEFIPTI